MSGDLFARLSAHHGDCPSEARLDALHLEELDAAARSEVEAHIGGCERCQSRMAVRSEGFKATPVDRDGILDRLAETQREAPRPSVAERLRTWFAASVMRPLAVGGLAVAAVAVAVMLAPPPETVRSKGGAQLHVLQLRADGKSIAVGPGGPVTGGDRLRFRVQAPGEGFYLVLGVEASGRRFAYLPADGVAASVDSLLPSGRPRQRDVPGAVQLDASKGREQIVLLWCPAPFQLGALPEALPPEGCEQSRLTVDKR